MVNNENNKDVSSKIDDLASSVEDLARMMVHGFEGIEERMAAKADLAELKLKVDDMDKKIDRLDFKIEGVREELNIVDETEILDLQKRVGVKKLSGRSLS